MSPEIVALIAAAIGATGAVVGQLIAAAFTAKRDTARLAWEQERARRADQNERLVRFLDLKRDTCTRYLNAVSEAEVALLQADAHLHLSLVSGDPDDIQTVRSALVKHDEDVGEQLYQLRKIRDDLALVAPELDQVTEEVWMALEYWRGYLVGDLEVEDGYYPGQFQDKVMAAVDACRKDMRRSLGVSDAGELDKAG